MSNDLSHPTNFFVAVSNTFGGVAAKPCFTISVLSVVSPFLKITEYSLGSYTAETSISSVTFEKSLSHFAKCMPSGGESRAVSGAVAAASYSTVWVSSTFSPSLNVTVNVSTSYTAFIVRSLVTFEKSLSHFLNVLPSFLGTSGAVTVSPCWTFGKVSSIFSPSINVTVYLLIVHLT